MSNSETLNILIQVGGNFVAEFDKANKALRDTARVASLSATELAKLSAAEKKSTRAKQSLAKATKDAAKATTDAAKAKKESAKAEEAIAKAAKAKTAVEREALKVLREQEKLNADVAKTTKAVSAAKLAGMKITAQSTKADRLAGKEKRTLAKAATAVENALKNEAAKKAARDVKALEKAAAQTAKELRATAKAATATERALKKKLAESAKLAEKRLQSLNSVARSVNSSLIAMANPIANATKLLVGLAASIAAVSGGGLALATRDFAQFETRMAAINTLLIGTATKELPLIKEAILDLSTVLPQTADNLSEAFYFIQSATQLGAAGLEVLEVAAKGATAGLTDANTAADALTTILNSYNLTAADSTMVMDTLFAAVVEGKLEFADLANNIGSVAAIGKVTNTSLAELTALIAGITKGTGQVEQGITSLRAGMVALIKPTDDQRAAFKQFGIQIEDSEGKLIGLVKVMQQIAKENLSTQVLGRLFPRIRALKGLAVFSSNIALINDSLKLTANSAGVLEEAYTKVMDTLAKQTGVLVGNVERLSIEFGEKLSPSLKGLVKDTIALVREFQQLDEKSGISAEVIQQVLAPAFDKVRESVRALQADLPNILGALDFSGLKSAMQGFLDIFDINLDTTSGWTTFLQSVIDATTSLTKFATSATATVLSLAKSIKSMLDVFSKIPGVSAENAGSIGAMALAYQLFGRELAGVALTVTGLVVSFKTLSAVSAATAATTATAAAGTGILLGAGASSLVLFSQALGLVGVALASWKIGKVIGEVTGLTEALDGAREAGTVGRITWIDSYAQIEAKRFEVLKERIGDAKFTIEEMRIATRELGIRATDSTEEWRKRLKFVRAGYKDIKAEIKGVFSGADLFTINQQVTELFGVADIESITKYREIIDSLKKEGASFLEAQKSLSSVIELFPKEERKGIEDITNRAKEALAASRLTFAALEDISAKALENLRKRGIKPVVIAPVDIGPKQSEATDKALADIKAFNAAYSTEIQRLAKIYQDQIDILTGKKQRLDTSAFDDVFDKIKGDIDAFIETASDLRKVSIGKSISAALGTPGVSAERIGKLKEMRRTIENLIDIDVKAKSLKSGGLIKFLEESLKGVKKTSDEYKLLTKLLTEVNEKGYAESIKLIDKANVAIAQTLGLKRNSLLVSLEQQATTEKDIALQAELREKIAGVRAALEFKDVIGAFTKFKTDDLEEYRQKILEVQQHLLELQTTGGGVPTENVSQQISLIEQALIKLKDKRATLSEKITAKEEKEVTKRVVAETKRVAAMLDKEEKLREKMVEKEIRLRGKVQEIIEEMETKKNLLILSGFEDAPDLELAKELRVDPSAFGFREARELAQGLTEEFVLAGVRMRETIAGGTQSIINELKATEPIVDKLFEVKDTDRFADDAYDVVTAYRNALQKELDARATTTDIASVSKFFGFDTIAIESEGARVGTLFSDSLTATTTLALSKLEFNIDFKTISDNLFSALENSAERFGVVLRETITKEVEKPYTLNIDTELTFGTGAVAGEL